MPFKKKSFAKIVSRMLYFSSQIRSIQMPRTCQVTGKKAGKGHKYAIRGIAKKKKGIGLNITGKTRRRFQPNMISKKLWFAEENRFITIKMTTAGLRTIDKVGLSAVIHKLRKQGQKV